MINWDIFHDRGYVISDKIFGDEDIASLNVIASKLNPSIGQSKQGWYNYLRLHEERDQGVDILNDIDWSYFWSHTPLDNPIINEKILQNKIIIIYTKDPFLIHGANYVVELIKGKNPIFLKK